MTKIEIQNKIDTIKKAIYNLQSQVDDFYNKEQAIKLILNSIYGAVGNPHMVFFNPYVAEAVTAQGKEIILYSEKIMNHYFMNIWHTDGKLHENLGLKIS
jgi:DNA polymerase elongation subunit (family B)